MAQDKSGQENYGQLRERLRSGSLTDEDIKRLEEIISHAEGGKESGGSLGTVGGRPVIAHLPGGLDVIK